MITKSYRWFGWMLVISALAISLAGCGESRSLTDPSNPASHPINKSRDNDNGWGFTK